MLICPFDAKTGQIFLTMWLLLNLSGHPDTMDKIKQDILSMNFY